MYDSEYKSNARYINMKKIIEKMFIGTLKPAVVRWTIVNTKKVIAETLRTGWNISFFCSVNLVKKPVAISETTVPGGKKKIR